MSDTPRTDERITVQQFGLDQVRTVPADFARTLERELTEARTQLAERDATIAQLRENGMRSGLAIIKLIDACQFRKGYDLAMQAGHDAISALNKTLGPIDDARHEAKGDPTA